MKCIRFSILMLTCLFTFAISADAKIVSEADKAKTVFAKFYQAMGKPYYTGLPDSALQKKLHLFLSAEFFEAIKQAEIRESECIAVYGKHNQQVIKVTPKGQAPAILKPPLVESSIFASQYEPPDSFKILSATPKNKKMMLLVEYTAFDGSTSANFTWKNKALLIRENGAWKIDDFIDMDDPDNKTEDENAYVKSFLKTFPSCKNEFKS
jgi:hypothetical protein